MLDRYTSRAVWEQLRNVTAATVSSNYSKVGTVIGSDAAATGTTATVITATGHSAAVGDEIVMTSGTYDEVAREVTAVDTDTITVEASFGGAPAAADTFSIVRPVAFNSTARPKIIQFLSTLNQEVLISFDGSTDQDVLAVNGAMSYDLNLNGLHLELGGFIYVKHAGTQPTSGNLYIKVIGA